MYSTFYEGFSEKLYSLVIRQNVHMVTPRPTAYVSGRLKNPGIIVFSIETSFTSQRTYYNRYFEWYKAYKK